VGFIPGIICGYLAKARMRRDPSLKGRGLATAGLAVGYSFAGLTVALAVAALCLGLSLAQLVKLELRKATESETPGNAGQAEQAAPPAAAPQRPGPAGPTRGGSTPATGRITTQLSGVSIPDTVASGRIHGAAFKCDRAEIRGARLVLRQGKDFFPDLAVEIGLFTRQLEGQTWTIVENTFPSGRPMIMLRWKPAGRTVSQPYMGGYTMQLEFGRKANGKIPGKIYLALPDAEQTSVAGTFEVQAP
jgi:hypothetical protein